MTIQKTYKVGKPFSWLPPYQTARALLRHTAYQYVTADSSVMHSRHFASFEGEEVKNILRLSFEANFGQLITVLGFLSLAYRKIFKCLTISFI